MIDRHKMEDYIVIDAKTSILICSLWMLFLFFKNLSNDIKHCITCNIERLALA